MVKPFVSSLVGSHKASRGGPPTSGTDTKPAVSAGQSYTTPGDSPELRQVLNRRRLTESGRPTGGEAEILAYVEKRLSSLTASQRSQVLDAAVIWELAAEEPEQAGAREAMSLLRASGIAAEPTSWTQLTAVAGKLARSRGGQDLAGWLNALHGVGLVPDGHGNSPAAVLERRRLALARYTDRLVREARELNLRALGAELPPVIFDDADAVVHVSSDPDDGRSHVELLWSFLRRHRVVLTGLPGSGKSTAVRRAAGRLARDWQMEQRGDEPEAAGLPLPVRVSLRDVNSLGTATSFRDRLVQMAVRDDPASDRATLQQELESRLDDGRPIALFLDALDETYIDRDRVVRELEEFLAGIPDSALVLVATRDIAYAQAATLGWADLRLRKPEASMAVVDAVLEVAARHKRIQTDATAEWVGLRHGWVRTVLDRDRDLAETPLIPVLLAVLASGQEVDRLPARRADVLRAVVEDVVGRHEIRRSDGRPLGSLHGESRGTAVMDAFATEAAVILDHAGVAPTVAVQAAVSEILNTDWGLATGQARAAAVAVVRFLDETGVFVVDEPAGTVTSRISLFAEVGDAIHGTQHSDQLDAWVAKRVEQRQIEPVMLAAELEPQVRPTIGRQLSRRADDIELARAANRSHRNAPWLSDADVEILRQRFVASVARGTAEGWSDWHRLVQLGVPGDLVAEAVAAAATHLPAHQLLARIQCALFGRGRASLIVDEDLVALLEVTHLPRSPSETERRPSIWELGLDRGLAEVQITAAEVLLERAHPRAVELVEALATGAADRLGEPLRDLLREHGHADAAARSEQHKHEVLSGNLAALLNDRNGSKYPDFLRLLAEWPAGVLTTRQRIELSELGEFAETLDLNDIGVSTFYGRPATFQSEVAALVADLFGFDRSVLAAQAAVLLARLEVDDSLDTYFCIFETSQGRHEVDWSRVQDPSKAAALLLDLFGMAPAQARLAAICMWGSNLMENFAADELRVRSTAYADHVKHQQLVALTLASFPSTPEPLPWLTSEDPVLRAVAAETIEPLLDGKASPELCELLRDQDGLVRHSAVKHLSRSGAADMRKLLEALIEGAPVGWTCTHCRKFNGPGQTSCTKDHFVGADPVAKARKLLEQVPEG